MDPIPADHALAVRLLTAHSGGESCAEASGSQWR
jgi:hypothetical protein